MIAGNTEFTNHILHRDITLLLTNLYNISKLLISLLWSRFHTPILSAATIRMALQPFQKLLRRLNFQAADIHLVGWNQVTLMMSRIILKTK